MGFDNSVQLGNVSSEEYATKVTSILEWAQDAGKDTGLPDLSLSKSQIKSYIKIVRNENFFVELFVSACGRFGTK